MATGGVEDEACIPQIALQRPISAAATSTLSSHATATATDNDTY